MIKLVGFEFKKILLHRSLLIVLLLFTLLDVWKIQDQWKSQSYFADSPGWAAAYWELYPTYAGAITPEKQEDLDALCNPIFDKVKDWTFNRAINPNSLTKINDFSDYLFLSRFYVSPWTRFSNYAEDATRVCQAAAENVQLYHGTGNTAEVEKNAKIYLLFQNRSITEFCYTERDERMASYTFSQYLVLLLCIYLWILCIEREKESKMDEMLHTMSYGGVPTVQSKIFVSASMTAFISLWFFLTDQIAFRAIYSWCKSGNMPLYSLVDFTYTPLNITLKSYTVLSGLLRIQALLFLMCVLYCAAAILKNALALFLVLLGGSEFLLWGSQALASCSNPWMKILNPCSFLTCYPLFRTCEFVVLGGKPFLAYQIAFWVQLLGTLTLLLVLLFTAGKQNFLLSHRNGRQKIGPKKSGKDKQVCHEK